MVSSVASLHLLWLRYVTFDKIESNKYIDKNFINKRLSSIFVIHNCIRVNVCVCEREREYVSACVWRMVLYTVSLIHTLIQRGPKKEKESSKMSLRIEPCVFIYVYFLRQMLFLNERMRCLWHTFLFFSVSVSAILHFFIPISSMRCTLYVEILGLMKWLYVYMRVTL